MMCEAEKNAHHQKQYTTDHKNIHIYYTVLPVMPMVAHLIKIFPTILWKIQFVTTFIRMALEVLTKHE